MTATTDPKNGPGPTDDDESGPYRIADDATAPSPGRKAARAPEPTPDLSDSQDRDPESTASEEMDGEDDGATDSLPPPISRETNPQVWLVVGGTCAALLALSWLAGAPQLSLPDADGNILELGFGERLNGLARTVVFLPLATLALAFGLGALAFVRQRPIGAIAPLFAKCLAIVCLATLVWLVPSDIRMVKQALNVIVLPLVAGALTMPLFRLSPRDAAFATAYGLLGMLLLIGSAWIVVWATT